MSEEHTDPETHRNVVIGLDGKPFEAWTPAVSERDEAAGDPADGRVAHLPGGFEPDLGEFGTEPAHFGTEPAHFETEPAHFETEAAPLVGATPPWSPGPGYSAGPIVEGLPPAPQSSTPTNTYAWLSIGLGGFALVSNMSVFLGRGGGLTWTASFLLAAAGLYFGLRSGSVSSRGYSPQRSLRIAGVSLSILAAVSTVALIARFLTALSRIF